MITTTKMMASPTNILNGKITWAATIGTMDSMIVIFSITAAYVVVNGLFFLWCYSKISKDLTMDEKIHNTAFWAVLVRKSTKSTMTVFLGNFSIENSDQFNIISDVHCHELMSLYPCWDFYLFNGPPEAWKKIEETLLTCNF